MTKQKPFQAMFQQKLHLDPKTKQKLQSFAPQMEEWKNKPIKESDFSRAVVCGEEEFKKPEPKKSLKN